MGVSLSPHNPRLHHHQSCCILAGGCGYPWQLQPLHLPTWQEDLLGKAVATFLRWLWEVLHLLLLLTLLLSCRGREGRMLWKALQKVPRRQREPPLCKACLCQSGQSPHDISFQPAPQHPEETLLCAMERTCPAVVDPHCKTASLEPQRDILLCSQSLWDPADTQIPSRAQELLLCA